MTENDGFNSPSQQDLEMIARSRDSLLQHRLEQQRNGAAKGAQMPDLKPGDKLCPICMKKILVISKDPSGYCLECEKNLKAGQTAIISMDGRHLFIQSDGNVEGEKDLFVHITSTLPKEWPAGFTVQGCVLPTSSQCMDALVKIHGKQVEHN